MSLKDHKIIQEYIKANRFGKLLGMDFSIEKPGKIEYQMEITKELLATPRVAHGGSISALMDAAMGVCGLSCVVEDHKVVSTVDMKLSFIAPGRLGDVLVAKANVIKAGKRLLFIEGRINNQEGELIAIATGTFNAYPAEKAGIEVPAVTN